ncbi:MAG: DUF4157 domain-containing protein [Deltaproteobacteria bacterium]|nr:DUF4157 domain-containing protein [Deltaproteobacteria bacterium]
MRTRGRRRRKRQSSNQPGDQSAGESGMMQRKADSQVSQLSSLIETSPVQPKLKVGTPGGKYEREADSVADRVMAIADPQVSREAEDKEEEVHGKALAEQITPLTQRQPEEEEKEEAQADQLQREVEAPEKEEEEPVQAKMLQRRPGEEEEPAQAKFLQRRPEEEEEGVQQQPEEEEKEVQAKERGQNSRALSSSAESGIKAIKGGGRPLPESTRKFFEPRFGADFRGVRIHLDSRAAGLAKAINAKAFTKGKDIVFGSGYYSPETSGGKRLLAHELTHVLQQSRKINRSADTVQMKGGKSCAGVHSLRASFFNYVDVVFYTTDSCKKVKVKISGEWEGDAHHISGPSHFPIILDKSTTKKVKAGSKGGGQYKRIPGKTHTFTFTLKAGKHKLRLSTGGINKGTPVGLRVKLHTRGSLTVS